MSGYHERSGITFAGHPLPPLLEELRGRCDAVASLSGGGTYYAEELAIFSEVSRRHGIIIPESEVAGMLSQPPGYEGNEHQVWFEEKTETFLKITWHDNFGLKVIHAADEDERASPIDYLERWHLHNELFADQVRFLGVVETSFGSLRMMIRQPSVEGTPATEEQIRDFFVGEGWKRFMAGGEVAYFAPEREVAVSDTHRGNLVMAPDGQLVPIDLRVQRLSGATLDTVKRLCVE